MNEKDDNDIPVLNDVVKRGNEDIIKTARLEKEIFEELDMLAPQLQRPVPQTASSDDKTPTDQTSVELHTAIDNIIKHHSRAMQQEIAELLENRLGIER